MKRLQRKQSKETREKIANSLKGKHVTDETRMKMSKSHEGKQLPYETRMKISQSLRNYWRTIPYICNNENNDK